MPAHRKTFVDQLRRLMAIMELFRDGHYHCARELRTHMLRHGYPISLRHTQRLLRELHEAGVVRIHQRQQE